MKESQDMLSQVRLIIKKTAEDSSVKMKPIDFDIVKGMITDNVSKFLFQKTGKRPLVIPVTIAV